MKPVDTFIELDDLPHAVICDSEIFIRPKAICFETFATEPTGHDLLNDLPTVRPKKIFAKIDNAFVRGSVLVEWNGRFLFPRTGSPSARESMIRYINGAATEVGDPFGCGITPLSDGLALKPLPTERLDGEFFLLTPDESNNYGMWLLQVLPTVLLAREWGYRGKFLCEISHEWQLNFIRIFAPEFVDRLVRQEPNVEYSVEKLNFIAQTERNLCLSQYEREIYQKLVNSRRPDRSRYPEKIFVSRRSASMKNPLYRALVNEDELIDEVRGKGFEMIEPEQYSFWEQIWRFASADVVIGLGGAGMFSSVFCNEESKILTIESSHMWLASHCMLFASNRLRYGAIVGQQFPNDPPPHQRWSIPVPIVSEVIDRFLRL